MKRLLNNKKGIFGDIIGFFQSLFQTITNILPKPVLFILFLFIMLFLGNLLSYVFNINGIYCNGADEPVKLNGNFINNLGLISEVPEKNNLNEINPTGLSFSDDITSCYKRIDATDNAIIKIIDKNSVREGNITNITTTQFFFNSPQCADCEDVELTYIEYNNAVQIKACSGYAYPLNYSDNSKITWYQKLVCGRTSCAVPQGFYFDYKTGLMKCSGNGCSGLTYSDDWNNKLKKYDATLLYPEIDGNSNRKLGYDEALGITCVDLQPKLSVYSINIFDYKLWVVLTLIFIMFWAYFHFT